MNIALQYLRRLYDYCKTLTLPQKISYAGAVVILAGALAFLFYLNNRTDFVPLYSGLSQNDMGEIAQSLKAKKIPYHISEGSIEVAREGLYETRLSLASDGIPKGSGMGFEIFDQQKLGSTEFVQKINYQRALQGELARTINGMSEVMESRVHLVMPEESLFKEDQKPPSAAVVLKLRSGARMADKELQGLVHLVAATVRGLEEDRITVMSTDGQVLYKKNKEDASQLSNTQLERKQRMEDDLRQKVQSMLEQVVGSNRVLARVALDLEMDQIQIAEETYNPDSAVIRSQQRTTESTEGKEAGVAKGNPDAPLNLEGKLLQNSPQAGEAAKPVKQSNRQREVVNYEINKITKQVVQVPGNIKQLSVAVIVDGKYDNKPGADGKPKQTYIARTAEEMKSMEDLVRKAVGYNETRGDQITVSNIPFASDMPGAEMVKAENKYLQLFKSWQRMLLNVGLAALVLVFVIRPFMRKFRQVADDIRRLPAPSSGPSSDEQITAMLLDKPFGQLSFRKKSTALVKHDPDKATEIIRQWLRDEV
ncbi:putative Flagellar M-ring protein [Syntrophobacter sp. SbD1]|nr:putative Flagellar M-ring protein [Syntrophobacter sp. SbD1]